MTSKYVLNRLTSMAEETLNTPKHAAPFCKAVRALANEFNTFGEELLDAIKELDGDIDHLNVVKDFNFDTDDTAGFCEAVQDMQHLIDIRIDLCKVFIKVYFH